MKRHWLIIPLIMLLVSCGSSAPKADLSAETKNLEIMSWWVSASEYPALDVLLNAFREAHPDVIVEGGTISGGVGSNVIVALAQRLQNGNPPDVWQTFVGSPARAYAADGYTADLSPIAGTREFSAVIPPVLSDAMKDNDKIVAMPTGSHRGNVLWFNRKMLEESQITVPGPEYGKDQFLQDLAALEGKGRVPMCVGGQDRFTTSELFENILLGEVGPDGYGRIADDSFNWEGAPVRSALTTYDQVMSYVGTNYRSMKWSDTAEKLATGGCAFVSMNDSFYGELVAKGAKEGVDFGWVAFPGTSEAYLAIVDAFVISSRTQNGKNAADFITTIADGPTELAFNKVKGSVPIRRDVNVSSLPPYQQQASQALWNQQIVLSLTHGELLDSAFQQALYDSLATFGDDHNVDAVMANLRKALSTQVVGGH